MLIPFIWPCLTGDSKDTQPHHNFGNSNHDKKEMEMDKEGWWGLGDAWESRACETRAWWEPMVEEKGNVSKYNSAP